MPTNSTTMLMIIVGTTCNSNGPSDVNAIRKNHLPDADKTRHAVAHRGEAASAVSELFSHAQDGVFLLGKMTARKYTITFGGLHRTLTVDGSVRRVLAEIANATTAAFPVIAPDLPKSPS
jgi:hypothetical protein